MCKEVAIEFVCLCIHTKLEHVYLTQRSNLHGNLIGMYICP